MIAPVRALKCAWRPTSFALFAAAALFLPATYALVTAMPVHASPLPAKTDPSLSPGLSPAERTVCRNLRQCLSILDRHPQDSFDYAVLVDAFARFGPRGRDALVRRIGKGGTKAGHAADLLALTRDASALEALDRLIGASNGETEALAIRTRQALAARLQSAANLSGESSSGEDIAEQDATAKACLVKSRPAFAARKREMPFFESNVATPDNDGAYRPSAAFRTPSRAASGAVRTERRWLTSAVAVPGGWFAAYPDGIVFYDNRTGAPRLRHERCTLALQRRHPDRLDPHVWAFTQESDRTVVLDVGPEAAEPFAALAGPLLSLARRNDGSLCAAAGGGNSVLLNPDGSTSQGCALLDDGWKDIEP